MPHFPRDATDCFLFVESDPETAADLIVDVVQNRIPHKFGLDPLNDVQVLSPMYRGAPPLFSGSSSTSVKSIPRPPRS